MKLRLIYRFIFFIGYTAYIVLKIRLLNLAKGVDMRRTMRIRRGWANRLLKRVGVSVTFHNPVPEGVFIAVSNHRSYIDPILILCRIDGYPVAKSEMANWPLLGNGAATTGILYLTREDAGSRLGTLRRMMEKLDDGFPIIIFPEGTTSDLEGTLPFKKGVFQMAARQQIPIVPIAIVLEKEDYWVSQVSFLEHAWERFGQKRIKAAVYFGEKMVDTDADRLLDTAKSWIDGHLNR